MEQYRTNFASGGPTYTWGSSSGLTTVSSFTLGVSGDNRYGRPGITFSTGAIWAAFVNVFPNVNRCGLHIAFYLPSLSQATTVAAYLDGQSVQVNLNVTTTGLLQVVLPSGAVLANSGANLLQANRWYSIEWEVVFASGGGATTVQVNNVQWLTQSSITTKTTANAYANGFSLGSPTASNANGQSYTDVVLWDTTGSANNTFYGDCRVDFMAATGTATMNNFTSFTGGLSDPSGTLYQSLTPNATVLSSVAAPPNITGIIKSVAPVIQARKTDNSFAHDAGLIVGTSSSGSLATETSSAVSSTTVWTTYGVSFPTQPSGAAWTTTDLNTLQVGAKVI